MKKKEYQPLTIPRLSWKKETLTESFGELVAQPLEPGFGVTLGNALRRTLLGGIEGSAVTSVIIDGVNNEFSTLEGVEEDVMQVILNIKQIIVKNTTGQPGTMSVQVNQAGPVLVGDIQADEHLTLVNKDHIIAHVSQGGQFSVQFFVESGRGYQTAQWPEGKPLQEDGRIYIDAMYAPVRRVSYDVQKTRVGKNIDFDKLVLSVQTDGSETPIDMVNYAVSVLRTQLEHFLTDAEIPFNEISEAPEDDSADGNGAEIGMKGIPVDLLLKPIDVLEFSVRAHNCLINAGIKRIIDLVNMTEDAMLKIKNFGRKSYDEVKEGMKSFGLSFGMDISEEDIQKLQKKKQKEHE